MHGIRDSNALEKHSKISSGCAGAVLDLCVSERLVLDNFSLDLDVSKVKVKEVLDARISPSYSEEYHQNESFILDTIMCSRYVNLYYLLRVSRVT